MASPRVVVGVAGGIAAYKVVELVRGLCEYGADVHVVPTRNAENFVGEATWSAISGNPVATDVWTSSHEVPHVALGQSADLVIVAPATADLLARASHGIASDLLTNVLVTARCPVLMAPAMHTEMWEHPATQRNVALLRERGIIIIEPATGRLTGADSGTGRLPEPAFLLAECRDHLRRAQLGRDHRSRDLSGHRVVISAGPTQEAWDPVRFLSNHSSGKQGVALARTAASRGAEVTLVLGTVDETVVREIPPSVTIQRVLSALDMEKAMLESAANASIVVMNAAVADFRPQESSHKIKKESGAPSLELEPTTDVLRELVARRLPHQIIVGFAAETGSPTESVLEMGRRKRAQKGCDVIVVNDVSEGRVFGQASNEVTILTEHDEIALPLAEKADVADRVWDAVLGLMDARAH